MAISATSGSYASAGIVIFLNQWLESFVHPVTIMLTLPLGAVGAFFALFLTASNLNLFSMMAMIMLVGIVVNNAILILDYAHILRTRGMALKEALLEAAPARLRAATWTTKFRSRPRKIGEGGSLRKELSH